MVMPIVPLQRRDLVLLGSTIQGTTPYPSHKSFLIEKRNIKIECAPTGEGPLVPTGPSCAGTGGPVPPLAPHVRALLPPFTLFVLSVASFSFFGASPTLRVPLPPLQSPAKGRRFALFLRHGTPTQACLLFLIATGRALGAHF